MERWDESLRQLTLEERVARLEKEIAELKGQVSERPKEITLLLDGQKLTSLQENLG